LVTPDVLDVVITKNLSFPVYLNSYSALSSDQLPVHIDNSCRSSFTTQRIALTSGALLGPASKIS